MASVQLEGITQQFGNTVAVKDITFTVPDGEFWVLVGPSGCGKSTLLRTIAGLEPVTAGQLYIGDRLVNSVPARQRDVAMVFQNYALYPHMSVAENLSFGLRMRQTNSQTIQDRIESVAQALGIAHLLDRKPRQLSGGQQQRVALGRAIARQPQVFLLDEPLSNLDAQLRDETRAELKQLHQKFGITTLYVTHDQVEAMTLADQIVVLNQGKVQQIGPPQTIYSQPANQMVASFMGNPPMNLLPVIYQGNDFKLETQTLPCPEAIQPHLQAFQDKKLTLGLRPEAIQMVEPAEGLQATVILVEPLGREVLVRVTLPPSDTKQPTLNLLVPPQLSPQAGEPVGLAVDLDQLFCFTTETGQRLYPI